MTFWKFQSQNIARKQIILCLLLFAIILSVNGKSCTKINSCSCRTDDGGLVDLSPLAKKDGTAMFDSIRDSISVNERFSWNPCQSFTDEGACTNVAVCKEELLIPNSTYFNIGTQDSAFFLYRNDSDLVLGYIGDNATTIIDLVCKDGEGSNLTVTGEIIQGTQIYNMILESIHACPEYPISPPVKHGSSGLSAGWVVFIVLMVLLVGYFAIGTVYNKVNNKAEGIEAVPHFTLIMGGCSYVKSCCSSGDKNRSQYSSV